MSAPLVYADPARPKPLRSLTQRQRQCLRLASRGMSSRRIRNWFEARNAPSGENLVALMGRSDEVLETVLHLAGRQDLIATRRLSGARDKLREMLAMIDDIQTG